MSAQPSNSTTGPDVSDSKPSWWPRGASEELVRDCNCEYCRDLIERLEDEHHAVEEGQPSLSAFGEGQR